MPIDIHVTPISLSILLDLVLKLKETFSPQDIVPTKLLKQVIEVIGAEQLTDVLTDIFSTLLSQAVIPTCLKSTTIQRYQRNHLCPV